MTHNLFNSYNNHRVRAICQNISWLVSAGCLATGPKKYILNRSLHKTANCHFCNMVISELSLSIFSSNFQLDESGYREKD